jgi:hypothetical protein
MQSKEWVHRVSHFRSRSPFPTESADFFLRLPSPAHLRKRVHPLVRFAPLQSTSVSQSAHDPKVVSAFLGVRGPSSRHRPPASKLRASHRSSPFRPRRFSRPRRFPPRLALWVCFTPLPRPGFTLQGFFTSSAAVSSFDDRCPLVVAPTLLKAVTHLRRSIGTRPQGFHLRPSR